MTLYWRELNLQRKLIPYPSKDDYNILISKLDPNSKILNDRFWLFGRGVTCKIVHGDCPYNWLHGSKIER